MGKLGNVLATPHFAPLPPLHHFPHLAGFPYVRARACLWSSVVILSRLQIANYSITDRSAGSVKAPGAVGARGRVFTVAIASLQDAAKLGGVCHLFPRGADG